MEEHMKDQIRPALTMLLLLTVLTGLSYPLAVTGLAQLFFPDQANGSLIVREGKVVGSKLIGQYFDKPEYFGVVRRPLCRFPTTPPHRVDRTSDRPTRS